MLKYLICFCLWKNASLIVERCRCIESANDFLATPDRMDIFDATCMRLQTIGETIKNIDNLTNHDC